MTDKQFLAAAALALAYALTFQACKPRESEPAPSSRPAASPAPAAQPSLTPPLMPKEGGPVEAAPGNVPCASCADRGMVMPVPYDASGPDDIFTDTGDKPMSLDSRVAIPVSSGTRPVSLPGSDRTSPERSVHPAKKAPPPL